MNQITLTSNLEGKFPGRLHLTDTEMLYQYAQDVWISAKERNRNKFFTTITGLFRGRIEITDK